MTTPSSTLACRILGTGPRPVVAVHGMAQSGVFWEPALRALPSGYRGYAIDLPGFGASAHIPGPYTIPTHAAAVAAFIAAHDLRDVVLVGNSMGGVVCMQTAISHPERLGALVLVSTGPRILSRPGTPAPVDAALDRESARVLVAHFFVQPPADLAPHIEAAMQASVQARIETRRSSSATDLRPGLPGIAIPTLIVQGELDTSRPPSLGEEMAALIPGAELHVIPGAGHTPMLEYPDAFQTIFHRFLDRTGGQGQ